jgi:zinc protease
LANQIKLYTVAFRSRNLDIERMINVLSVALETYHLTNGLTVLLHQTRDVPVVAVEVMYHVGSKNEQPGRTGLAHLFEHMMFKGSAHVPDGEHFRRLQDIGAEVNGSTTEDRTNYYEVLPPEHLETALYLEADRMGGLVPALTQAKLDNQRDVVKNERRQSYENQPYGMAQETIDAAVYPPGHPYSWPVIGSMHDLDQVSLDDLREFFNRMYSPANAVLTIAGNFDADLTRGWIEKYFGGIHALSPFPPPAAVPRTPAPSRRITLHDAVTLPRVYLAWRSVPWFTDEDASLDTATDILGAGKNSRLNRALVIEQQLAQSATAYQHGLEIDGKLVLVATARKGVEPDALIAALMGQVDLFIQHGMEPREFQKSLHMKEAALVFGFEAMRDRAHRFSSFQTLTGSALNYRVQHERYAAMTPEGVMKQAALTFASEPVILEILPRVPA